MMQGQEGVMADPERSYRRAKRAVLWTIGVCGFLLATHLGEFWPFSIYPMFSRAGRPFTRSVVREVGPDVRVGQGPYGLDALPGKPFPLAPVGIAQNDIANFVSKTAEWTPERKQAMQHVFAEHTQDRRLVVFAARGAPAAAGVEVTYRPIIELSASGPKLLVR